MDMTPLIKEGSKVIQSYSDEAITVNGERFEENIIVTPDEIVSFSGKLFEELDISDLQVLEGKNIDVLLVGTGEEQKFFSGEIKDFLKLIDIVSETMTSGAAARTYNVLMAEGRHIAALFIL